MNELEHLLALQQRHDEQERALGRAQSDFSTAHRRAMELRDAVRGLSSNPQDAQRLAEVEADLSRVLETQHAAEQRVEEARAALEQTVAELAELTDGPDAVRTYKAAIEQQQARLRQHEQALDQARQQHARTESQRAELSGRREALLTEQAGLLDVKTLEASRAKVAKLDAELDTLGTLAANQARHCHQVEQEHAAAGARLAELEVTLNRKIIDAYSRDFLQHGLPLLLKAWALRIEIGEGGITPGQFAQYLLKDYKVEPDEQRAIAEQAREAAT